MADATRPLYEGMYLVNVQEVGGDLNAAMDHVRESLERANADILSFRRWDDRRLAYPVRTLKRGTFIYSLFRCDPVQIANIERDCNLSEIILRAMMLRADHMGEIEIEQELKEAGEREVEAKLHEGQDPVDDTLGEDDEASSDQAFDEKEEQEQPAAAASDDVES